MPGLGLAALPGERQLFFTKPDLMLVEGFH